MSDLDSYLDAEIEGARRSLLVTAIVCSVLVFGVLVVARRGVDEASRRLSSEAIVSQVGGIADREIASRRADIDEHIRTWIPQMLLSGPQSAIAGTDRYRLKLEDRVRAALVSGVDPQRGLDAAFAPVTMTRDRVKRLAANGSDLLPFDRLARRAIAVLLR